MDLEQYFRSQKTSDHWLRTTILDDVVEFYLHPHGVDGDTPFFCLKNGKLYPLDFEIETPDGIRKICIHWATTIKEVIDMVADNIEDKENYELIIKTNTFYYNDECSFVYMWHCCPGNALNDRIILRRKGE